MLDLQSYFLATPFSWEHAEKASRLIVALKVLQSHHETSCPEFLRLLGLLGGGKQPLSIEEFIYLPARLFKMHSLRSVVEQQVFKTMTSSGTSGQVVSKIFLDKDTAIIQTKALAHVVADFIGKRRLPMIIIDSKSVLKDPKLFSARGAGILGFSNFGSDHFYALNENMKLDVEGLRCYVEKHRGKPMIFFGFTFLIWLHFCQVLERNGISLDVEVPLVIHGGGWKKLKEQSVSNEDFKKRLRNVCGTNTRVHNFYGMVEQTGSIYVECERGYLHASNFSDIIIRDTISLEPIGFRRKGLIETISILPWSYPGHALLTEDIGELIGEDECLCGRKGKYFIVHGRLPKADARGCSDTYAMG